jgi:cytochrome c6
MNRTAVRIAQALLLAAAPVFLLNSVTRAADDAAALYKTKCEICHAKDGSGKTDMGKSTKVHDFRSPEVQNMTDEQLIAVTTNGKGNMPAYKGKLTDAQIKALVAYVRGLAKKS